LYDEAEIKAEEEVTKEKEEDDEMLISILNTPEPLKEK
jgi:hypothetical protein